MTCPHVTAVDLLVSKNEISRGHLFVHAWYFVVYFTDGFDDGFARMIARTPISFLLHAGFRSRGVTACFSC